MSEMDGDIQNLWDEMLRNDDSGVSGNRPMFRNPEMFQVLPLREFLREHMPRGADGFVAEDLDLVVRWYGFGFGTDSAGKFMLIEVKYKDAPLGVAQRRTFGLIDECLRRGDPDGLRYLGYYVLRNYQNEWKDGGRFRVNDTELDFEQLKAWFRKELWIAPVDFGNTISVGHKT